MGVCCRYALSIVIPARLRDSSYSRGRDFNSFAMSLASLPGRTGKVNAMRDILAPPSESYAKGDRTASLLDRHAGRDRPVCGVSPARGPSRRTAVGAVVDLNTQVPNFRPKGKRLLEKNIVAYTRSLSR